MLTVPGGKPLSLGVKKNPFLGIMLAIAIPYLPVKAEERKTGS